MNWEVNGINGIDYPVIDAHAHPYLNRDCPRNGPVDFDAFQAGLAAAGISMFCGTANIRNNGENPEIIEQENAEVLKWRDHFGKSFYPGVNIHPAFPAESIAAMEKFHSMGFRWIGEIAWYVQGYNAYATPEMNPILEAAEDLDMILNCHPTDADDLDRLLNNFPRLNVVIAHPESISGGCGGMYSLLEKHSNAFLDLSGNGLSRWHMLRWGIDRLGAEHILFGTDYPINNPNMYVHGVLSEPLTDAERKAVFHDNFIRLTGIQFETGVDDADC